MSASDDRARRPFPFRRSVVILAIALVLAIVVVVAVAMTTRDGQDSGAAGTPPPSAPTASPGPTESPTTPTPSPTPGAGNPAEAEETPIDESAEVAGLEIAIASIEAVDGVADEPGEIAGPALRVTVRFENGTDEPVSLRETVVTLDSGADRTPAPELNTAGGGDLPAELQSGEQAEGAYVFTLPESEREDIRITVFTSVSAPEVVFTGSAPS